jgi:hypothetical protein
MSDKTNNALWQFQNSNDTKFRVVDVFNSHNAFWHVEKFHDAKFVSWLLEKMTETRSGIMELPERFVVVSFYNHDTLSGKSYRTVEECFSK